MFSPIFMSQGNNIVSDTKAVIETHVAENSIRITAIIIRKTTTESITQQKKCSSYM